MERKGRSFLVAFYLPHSLQTHNCLSIIEAHKNKKKVTIKLVSKIKEKKSLVRGRHHR